MADVLVEALAPAGLSENAVAAHLPHSVDPEFVRVIEPGSVDETVDLDALRATPQGQHFIGDSGRRVW